MDVGRAGLVLVAAQVVAHGGQAGQGPRVELVQAVERRIGVRGQNDAGKRPRLLSLAGAVAPVHQVARGGVAAERHGLAQHKLV